MYDPPSSHVWLVSRLNARDPAEETETLSNADHWIKVAPE